MSWDRTILGWMVSMEIIKLGKKEYVCPVCKYKFSGDYPMIKDEIGFIICDFCYRKEQEDEKTK